MSSAYTQTCTFSSCFGCASRCWRPDFVCRRGNNRQRLLSRSGCRCNRRHSRRRSQPRLPTRLSRPIPLRMKMKRRTCSSAPPAPGSLPGTLVMLSLAGTTDVCSCWKTSVKQQVKRTLGYPLRYPSTQDEQIGNVTSVSKAFLIHPAFFSSVLSCFWVFLFCFFFKLLFLT